MMKNKRVLVVLASPRRNGGSARLARKIAEGARNRGARVDTVFVHELDIGWCKACEKCHKKGAKGCRVDDGMTALYPLIRNADAFVFASPIYFFTMSAQLKTFLDRTYAVYDPETGGSAFQGKPFALAFAYGADDPLEAGCINALRPFQDGFVRYLEARLVGLVYGNTEACRKDGNLLEQAQELGRKLVEQA
jgi:multimeric flavodoxin WrbA